MPLSSNVCGFLGVVSCFLDEVVIGIVVVAVIAREDSGAVARDAK